MIGIVLDTNIINSGSRDFMTAQFYNKLDDIIRTLESNEYNQDVKILLPRIVVEELYQHQMTNYHKEIDKLSGLKLPGLVYEQKDDYTATLTKIFDDAIADLVQRSLRTEVIDFPKNEVLPHIIDRAILKQAPFEGEDKSSDKGFKDVLLWESVLEYKRLHADDRLILFTSDKRLCEPSLNAEYKSMFGEEIYLLNQTKGNDYSVLFDIVSNLLADKAPIKNTFNEENKQRLLRLINNDNISPLFEGWPIEVEEGSFICSSIRVNEKSITDIEDLPEEGKIRYKVNINMSVDSSDKEYGSMFWDDTAEITVDYYLEEDAFYFHQVDGFNGYCEYEEKDYPLIED